MPMGDYKGLGLAYVVDILSGVISGGVFSHQMKSMYANPEEPSLTGHFMIVLDISKIIPKEEMKKRMKEYYDTLKATPMLEEGTEMFLPGEIEYRKERERLRDGVPVPETTIEELKELAEKYNVNKPLTVLE